MSSQKNNIPSLENIHIATITRQSQPKPLSTTSTYITSSSSSHEEPSNASSNHQTLLNLTNRPAENNQHPAHMLWGIGTQFSNTHAETSQPSKVNPSDAEVGSQFATVKQPLKWPTKLAAYDLYDRPGAQSSSSSSADGPLSPAVSDKSKDKDVKSPRKRRKIERT